MMAELGHVVFYVRDLATAERFYTEVVGLDIQGRVFSGRASLLSGGRTHHELLLIEVGDAPAPAHGRRRGLYHVGWKIGDDIGTLKSKYHDLLEKGYRVDGLSDHTVSWSLYMHDPDGNEIELYVDNPSCDWHTDKAWMDAPVRPLEL
jgi:catechol 2,3-dioxygenase